MSSLHRTRCLNCDAPTRILISAQENEVDNYQDFTIRLTGSLKIVTDDGLKHWLECKKCSHRVLTNIFMRKEWAE